MVMVLMWLIVFRFLTWNYHSNLKNLVPLNNSKKKVTLSQSLWKTKLNDTIGFAMVVVVFILRSMKHEKECETKNVTRTPSSGILSPNLHKQIPFRTPFIDLAEHFRVWGDFVWKLVEICCSKTCFNFGRCYGNQGWAETVENQTLFFKISSFDKSESFNSLAQGVLEIF